MNQKLKVYFFEVSSIISNKGLRFYRIIFGLVWVVTLINRLDSINFFISSNAILNIEQAKALNGLHRFSLFLIWDSLLFVQIVFIVGIIAGIIFAIGKFTKTMSFFCWIIAISIINRCEPILTGGDFYFAAFFFVNIFCSLSESKISFETAKFEIGKMIFIIQIVILYFFAGLIKDGNFWKSGEALEIILNLKITTRNWSSFLLEYPNLLNILTRIVPYMEMSSLLFLFPKKSFRKAKLLLATVLVLFHIGILIFMQVYFLPFLCIAVLLPLMPIFKDRFFHIDSINSNGLSKKQVLMPILFFILCSIGNIQASYPLLSNTFIQNTYSFFRFDQFWNFFGPTPNTKNSWWNIKIINQNGIKSNYDVFPSTSENFEPKDYLAIYKNFEWAVFFLGLSYPEYTSKLVPILANFICRYGIYSVQINQVGYFISPHSVKSEIQKISSYNQICIHN